MQKHRRPLKRLMLTTGSGTLTGHYERFIVEEATSSNIRNWLAFAYGITPNGHPIPEEQEEDPIPYGRSSAE
jgi:hypothetical protein